MADRADASPKAAATIAPVAGRRVTFPDGRALLSPREVIWSPWWARKLAAGDITRRAAQARRKSTKRQGASL